MNSVLYCLLTSILHFVGSVKYVWELPGGQSVAQGKNKMFFTCGQIEAQGKNKVLFMWPSRLDAKAIISGIHVSPGVLQKGYLGRTCFSSNKHLNL